MSGIDTIVNVGIGILVSMFLLGVFSKMASFFFEMLKDMGWALIMDKGGRIIAFCVLVGLVSYAVLKVKGIPSI